MMEISKKCKLLLASVIYLGACWWIGQATHPQGVVNVAQIQEESQPQHDTLPTVLTMSYSGNQVTADNPWGTTAGTIDYADQEYFFLTPNTSVEITNLDCTTENGSYILHYGIHPWVSEQSDGLGICITGYDENENVIYQERIAVTPEMKFTELNLEPDIEKLNISCDNGDYGNDDADWLIGRIG